MASIPLSNICDIKKFSKKNLPKDKQMFLMDGFEILCSNIQSHRVRTLALSSEYEFSLQFLLQFLLYNYK